jgi:predicted DNA-binding transcriptional regulator AlpA
MTEEVTLLTTAQTRCRLGGVSTMFIHRHLKNDPDFPKPIRFAPNGPRFWMLSEIEKYIELRREKVN